MQQYLSPQQLEAAPSIHNAFDKFYFSDASFCQSIIPHFPEFFRLNGLVFLISTNLF